MKRYKMQMVHAKDVASMEKPFSKWRESSSGLANESQVIDSSSSTTQLIPDVTARGVQPTALRTECPILLRSRREIFEEALGVTMSRNRAALDELGKF